MPRKSRYNGLLPDCEGPKLGPFKHRSAAIEFRRLLSDGDPEATGHAYVFEVCINSMPYALKVFRFYDDAEDEENLSAEDKKKVNIGLLHAHMDPFYNECRAYGKLLDAKQNGKIAVRCHGYLVLPATVEDELEEKFHVGMWDRPSEEYDKPVSRRQPLRAIVKDLIRDDDEFTEKDVSKMLRHLKHLRRLGVYPMDVRSRNYRAGLLIDFSVARTEPHYLFDTRPDWQVRSLKAEDLLLFDQMIEQAKIDTWERATPNHIYKEKLRRPPKKKTTFDR